MIIDYIHAHQAEFWTAVGFTLLALEVLLFGMSTMVLLFAGLGAIVTGLIMMTGLMQETWINGFTSFGVISGLSSVLLWKPLRDLQHAERPDPGQTSDLIGMQFVIGGSIDRKQATDYSYSGVTWRVELDPDSKLDSLDAGTRVRVVEVDVGVFRVVAAD